MKKIVIIVIVGKNRIINNRTWVLEIDIHEFNRYFTELTDNAAIAITETMYFTLPHRSPPYPCRNTYIISNNSDITELKNDIEQRKSKNVVAVDSIHRLIEITQDIEKPLFFIGEPEICNDLFGSHSHLINEVIEITVDQDFDGDNYFECLSPLNWQILPVKTIKPGGPKKFAITINKYIANIVI